MVIEMYGRNFTFTGMLGFVSQILRNMLEFQLFVAVFKKFGNWRCFFKEYRHKSQGKDVCCFNMQICVPQQNFEFFLAIKALYFDRKYPFVEFI